MQSSNDSIWTESLSTSTPWDIVVPASAAARTPRDGKKSAAPPTAVVRAESELRAIDDLMAELNELDQLRKNAVV